MNSSIKEDYKGKLVGNKQPTKTQKIVGVIAIIFVVLIFIAIIAPSSKNEGENQVIDEEKAESACMDALATRYDQNIYDSVNIFNKNPQYTDNIGWFDKDGNEIVNYRWNGNKKETNTNALADCWISKNGEDTTIHWLNFDNIDLIGDSNYERYDRDGNDLNLSE